MRTKDNSHDQRVKLKLVDCKTNSWHLKIRHLFVHPSNTVDISGGMVKPILLGNGLFNWHVLQDNEKLIFTISENATVGKIATRYAVNQVISWEGEEDDYCRWGIEP